MAQKLGVAVVELVADRSREAGSFTLRPLEAMGGAPARGGLAGRDDVALVLHTSGTTSRPNSCSDRSACSNGSVAKFTWSDAISNPPTSS